MTHNEIRDRLLLIARDRLRNRPGAYGQCQHAIENTERGVAMISAAHLMPHVWQVGEQMGNQKATELVREHLTRIVDEWAQSQPLPPAVEPLPGAEPPPIGPARADTRDTATPAPVVADSASNAHVVPFKKAALIAAHVHEWPTIERDISDAKANGLATAAKSGARGWREADALTWARAKGKLISAAKPADSLTQAMHNLGALPRRKHTIQG